MTTFNVTGALEFDVYTFSFAALFADFTVVNYDNASSTLTLTATSNLGSSLVIVGITSFTSLGQVWGGTISAINYSQAGVGQFSLFDFAINAETFRTLAQSNSRALFASLFHSNDSVSYETGVAKIELGAGDDTFAGSSRDDFIVAGSGTDTISGNGGFDTLDYANHAAALAGITVMMINNGSGTVMDPSGDTDTFSSIERITGTSRADIFNGSSDVTSITEWVGGDGVDNFNGSAGFETINFDADKYTTSQIFSTGISANIATGTVVDNFGNADEFSNIEAIIATDNADIVTGAGFAFATSLRAGNDTFNGGAGDEWINPGAGNDTVNGGSGYDTISYLQNDTAPVNFYATLPFIVGGIVVFSGTTRGAATVYDQYGGVDVATQIELIMGSENSDVFFAGSAGFYFSGGKGNDTFTATAATFAVLDYSVEIQNGGTAGISIDLLTSTGIDCFGDIDRIFGFSNFRGTAFADSFVGTNAVQATFFAGGGDDIVQFASRDDFVAPGAGNDTLDGGIGYDQLNYADIAPINGEGIQVIKFGINNGEVLNANEDHDAFNEFEFIFGTVGNDTFNNGIYGGDVSGGDGNDTFNGGTSSTIFDIVDYNAEKYYGGWQNAVIVNLSNAAFTAPNALTIAANSARDSFGKIDAMNEIDIVRGTGLNDIFVAGTKSIFEGGAGNDTYWLDGNDSAIEKFGAGTDLVYSKTSMSLPSYVENLTLIGSSQWAVGNSSNNNIVGNAYNNFISGNLGSDTLSGKSGRDSFRFDTKLSTANRDTITDFSSTYDQLSLDKSYFSKIGNLGKLESKAFWTGTSAHDSTDRIIYNRATGAIYYDPDGTGSATKMHFATLSNKASLSYTDFDIVA